MMGTFQMFRISSVALRWLFTQMAAAWPWQRTHLPITANTQRTNPNAFYATTYMHKYKNFVSGATLAAQRLGRWSGNQLSATDGSAHIILLQKLFHVRHCTRSSRSCDHIHVWVCCAVVDMRLLWKYMHIDIYIHILNHKLTYEFRLSCK